MNRISEKKMQLNPFDRTRNSPVFILGAGFSHSYNSEFPLTNELLRKAAKQEKVAKDFSVLFEYIDDFFDPDEIINFEKLASFLLQDPFPLGKQRPCANKDTYLDLIALINVVLENRNLISNNKNNPLIKCFVDFLKEKNAVVITFNYDLILEKFLKEDGWNPITGYNMEFYMPFSTQQYPPGGKFQSPAILKLHGSLNWGIEPEDFENLHNAKIYLSSETFQEASFRTKFIGYFYEHVNYYPFLLPPVIGKTYLHPSIRKNWDVARAALHNASEIFIIGFSLPESDVIAEYLFRHVIQQSINIHLVMPEIKEGDPTYKRFESAFRVKKYMNTLITHAMDAMEYIRSEILQGRCV